MHIFAGWHKFLLHKKHVRRHILLISTEASRVARSSVGRRAPLLRVVSFEIPDTKRLRGPDGSPFLEARGGVWRLCRRASRNGLQRKFSQKNEGLRGKKERSVTPRAKCTAGCNTSIVAGFVGRAQQIVVYVAIMSDVSNGTFQKLCAAVPSPAKFKLRKRGGSRMHNVNKPRHTQRHRHRHTARTCTHALAT